MRFAIHALTRPLQDRFLVFLIAASAYGMRRFSSLFRAFYNVSKLTSSGYVLKGVALLLTFPCFELSQLCFQLAYVLNRFRIARLGGEDLLPQLRNGRISNGNIIHVLKGLRDAEHRI